MKAAKETADPKIIADKYIESSKDTAALNIQEPTVRTRARLC
jgi:hypothetical protein